MGEKKSKLHFGNERRIHDAVACAIVLMWIESISVKVGATDSVALFKKDKDLGILAKSAK